MKNLQVKGQQFETRRERDVLRYLISTSSGDKLWIGVLLFLVVLGLIGYYRQLKFGLIVTAMRDYTSWGIYISNFVFFVAASLVGSLFSSILRLNKNEWARPLIRVSEMIAVAAIICAAAIIIVDMGRPDRFFYVIKYLRIQSPIIWDVIIIATYLVISLLMLYVSVLPDLAFCRDRLTVIPRWKKRFYRIVAINWENNPKQRDILSKISLILAISVLPVAFAIHTITSWLFATTWRPGWDSTNLGPYFVSGAFMTGAAMIIVAMFFIRKHLNLKAYITEIHFDRMGKLLVLLSLVYLYFNINEYLGPSFKMVGVEGEHITELFVGKYAPMYWFVQVGGLILPIVLLIIKKMRTPLPMMVISMFVIVGAWLKRYLIVIPSLQHPYLPIQGVDESYLHYYPTWEEWAITISSVAWFLLIVTVLMKLFPVIPIRRESTKDQQRKKKLGRKKNVNPALMILCFFSLSSIPNYSVYGQEAMQDAHIELAFEEIDDSKKIVATVYDSVNMPVEEVDLYFYVERTFGLLPIGDVFNTTDESGIVEIEFPGDLPGGEEGQVNIVVKLMESDIYNDLTLETTKNWGVPTSLDISEEQRSLWAAAANAPIPLVIITSSLILAMWFMIFYIIYMLIKISRKNGLKIDNTL